MAELSRKGPLTDVESETLLSERDSLAITSVPGLTKVKLQLRKQAQAHRSSIGQILGAALPENPLQPVDGEPALFWSAPGEWLIISAGRKAAEIEAPLAALLVGQTHAITDLSDSLAAIQLSGPGSTALLQEACAVDLHPSAFSPGRYALTRFGPLTAIIHKYDEGPGFRLYVDRSVARFLWNWFVDAKLVCSR